jgi:hypothetical protein
MPPTSVQPTQYVVGNTATPGSMTLLPSAARTITQTLLCKNLSGRGIEVIVSTTAIGTGSITFSINAVDSLGNVFATAILTGAAITTNTVNRYLVYPELTAVASSIAQNVIGHDFQITITANNANAATYSVSACIIP